jgi:hypothetical protein
MLLGTDLVVLFGKHQKKIRKGLTELLKRPQLALESDVLFHYSVTVCLIGAAGTR